MKNKRNSLKQLPDIIKRGPVNKSSVSPSASRPQRITQKRSSLQPQFQSNSDLIGFSQARSRRKLRPSLDTVVNPKYQLPPVKASSPPRHQSVDQGPSSLTVLRNAHNYDMYLKPQFRSGVTTYRPSLNKNPSASKPLKTLINGKAWIPGGHPNSLGRNKLGSHILKNTGLYY